MKIQTVCVYCASSRQADEIYRAEAFQLGQLLAEQQFSIVYGGGAVGSMGALADGALSVGGKVIGVIPQFMMELEWGHTRLSELRVVESMHERKQMMLEEADAVIALPGGCGTLEELFEAITWKRLGFFFGPVILVNTRSFFDPCVALLEKAVEEKFMSPKHGNLWSVVQRANEVIPALKSATNWPKNAREFAAL